MTTPSKQVRRATIEDLPHLAALWNERGLPTSDLEKRFKEFQVVEGEQGAILGAFGLQVVGQDGAIHSEVFVDPETSEELRARLWDRVQIVIKNHGLARIWTQSPSEFWQQTGFGFASNETITKRPAAISGYPGPWLVLSLREEGSPLATLDKEFALFRESERESTDRLFRQARLMKIVAGIVAAIVLVLVIFWAISFLKLQRSPRG